MTNLDFDVIIIGSGLSGFGAGIRIAMSGQKVLIVEQHYSIGGLNGFYIKNGFKYDVGLHAITNFVKKSSNGNHPFIKLLRQLRIPYESFQLEEQLNSKIKIQDVSINFCNDYEKFIEEIKTYFPGEIDNLLKLDKAIEDFSNKSTSIKCNKFMSTMEIIGKFIKNRFLCDIILFPLLYYGSAQSNDIDWRQFVILYKSIYKEGFAKPKGGIRTILSCLRSRYLECGGKLILNNGVESIKIEQNSAVNLTLKTGEILKSKTILSSAGYYETQYLCGKEIMSKNCALSFAETITTYKNSPVDLNLNDTIIFFNKLDKINYEQPPNYLWLQSGVICISENYKTIRNESKVTTLRTTHLANYDKWKALDPIAYREQKMIEISKSREIAIKELGMKENCVILAEDMFTPLTIERFTKHKNGAIYGSVEKFRDGNIGYDNLFIIGTDQGFLGIIGSILSGISMANYHCIQNLR